MINIMPNEDRVLIPVSLRHRLVAGVAVSDIRGHPHPALQRAAVSWNSVQIGSPLAATTPTAIDWRRDTQVYRRRDPALPFAATEPSRRWQVLLTEFQHRHHWRASTDRAVADQGDRRDLSVGIFCAKTLVVVGLNSARTSS